MKKVVLAVLAAAALQAGVFDQGSKNVAVTLGSGSGYNNNYMILGVAANYFALNGVSAGVGFRGWLGGTPRIYEVDVPVTYYVPLQSQIRPYVGAFYRRTFISDGFSDYDTYGARAGAAYVQGNGYISIGWVQEWYSISNGDDSSRGYPEVAAGFSF